MMTISDGTVDVPMASSSGRVDAMLKNYTFDVISLFLGMILSLPLELAIGTSMMLSDIVIIGGIIRYLKHQNWALIQNLYLTQYLQTSRVKYMLRLTLTVHIPCNTL